MGGINQETVSVEVFYQLKVGASLQPGSYTTKVNPDCTDEQIAGYFKQNDCRIIIPVGGKECPATVKLLGISRVSLEYLAYKLINLKDYPWHTDQDAPQSAG